MKKKQLISLFAVLAFAAFLTATPVSAQSNTACNCVLYVRTRVPSLPTGLNTQQDKERIINSLFPKVGTVAIHSINHVSYVERTEVAADGTMIIHLREANFRACQIGTRRGTASQLQIVGFFDPAFPAGSTPPEVTSASPMTIRARSQMTMTVMGRGFDAGSAQLIVLGGACSSWGACAVPTSVITNRSSTRLSVPVTLNSPGRFTGYVYNSRTGRSSNGFTINVN